MGHGIKNISSLRVYGFPKLGVLVKEPGIFIRILGYVHEVSVAGNS